MCDPRAYRYAQDPEQWMYKEEKYSTLFSALLSLLFHSDIFTPSFISFEWESRCAAWRGGGVAGEGGYLSLQSRATCKLKSVAMEAFICY